jgi:hypothetical protein
MPPANSAASRWRVILDEFQQSGLKQAEFCRRRGLSLHTFRKYLYGSRPVAPPARAVEFLPVTTPVQQTRHEPAADLIVLILAEGRRVAVSPGFDSQTLRRLLETVEGLA